MQNNLPSFVIAGASFSGAEILYTLLKSNPALFFPAGKPSAFFYRSDLYSRGIAPYKKLFENVGGHRVAGDIGVTYFEHGIVLNAEKKYLWQPQEDAALRLKKHCESAKIILCLRHPLERAYLQFQQAQKARIEKASSFADALREELEEKRSPEKHPLCYLYRNRAGYHAAHWRRVFGAGNLHICFYEDMMADISSTLTAVNTFIGVRPHKPELVDIAKAREDVPANLSGILDFLGRFPSLRPLQNMWLSRLKPKHNTGIKLPALDNLLQESITTLLSKDIADLEMLCGRKDIAALWPLSR